MCVNAAACVSWVFQCRHIGRWVMASELLSWSTSTVHSDRRTALLLSPDVTPFSSTYHTRIPTRTHNRVSYSVGQLRITYHIGPSAHILHKKAILHSWSLLQSLSKCDKEKMQTRCPPLCCSVSWGEWGGEMEVPPLIHFVHVSCSHSFFLEVHKTMLFI